MSKGDARPIASDRNGISPFFRLGLPDDLVPIMQNEFGVGLPRRNALPATNNHKWGIDRFIIA
jgi:hypothetical protein